MIRNSGAALKRLFRIGISVSLIAYILSGLAFEEIGQAVSQVPLSLLPTLILFFIVTVLAASLRLWRLLFHFGSKVPALTAFRANLSGLLASLVVIAPIGAIVGRDRILRRSGINVSSIAMMSLYERLIMLLVGSLFFILGILAHFEFSHIAQMVRNIPVGQMTIAICVTFAAALLIFGDEIKQNLMRRLFSRTTGISFAEIGLHTILIQSITISAFVLCLVTIGPDIPLLSLFAAAAVVSFAASLPISVNGWGVREVASIYFFGNVGVPSAEALTISLLVGLSATLSILLLSPMLMIRKDAAAAIPAEQPVPAQQSSAIAPPPRPSSRTDMEKSLAFMIPILAGIFVFFQFHISLGGSQLNLNLADPFIPVAAIVFLLNFFQSKKLPAKLPHWTNLWLLACSMIILISFLIGVWRFGVTSWALNNRLIGWGMLLGYFAAGTMLVGAWGNRGRRNLHEILLITACVVILTVVVSELARFTFGLDILLTANFEGYSANRNSFAFQLIIALGIAIAMLASASRLDSQRQRILIPLTSILIYGIWATQSNTGIIVLVSLLCLNLLLGTLSIRNGIAIGLSVFLIYGILWAYPWIIINSGWFSDLNITGRVRYSHIEPLSHSSLKEHWDTFVGGLRMWLDNPLFGGGLGAYLNQKHLSASGEAMVIHSTPAWLLAELGLAGFVTFLSPAFVGLYLYFRKFRKKYATSSILLVNLVFAFLLFGLPHDIFSQRIFWLVLGATLAGYAGSRTRKA